MPVGPTDDIEVFSGFMVGAVAIDVPEVVVLTLLSVVCVVLVAPLLLLQLPLKKTLKLTLTLTSDTSVLWLRSVAAPPGMKLGGTVDVLATGTAEDPPTGTAEEPPIVKKSSTVEALSLLSCSYGNPV